MVAHFPLPLRAPLVRKPSSFPPHHAALRKSFVPFSLPISFLLHLEAHYFLAYTVFFNPPCLLRTDFSHPAHLPVFSRSLPLSLTLDLHPFLSLSRYFSFPFRGRIPPLPRLLRPPVYLALLILRQRATSQKKGRPGKCQVHRQSGRVAAVLQTLGGLSTRPKVEVQIRKRPLSCYLLTGFGGSRSTEEARTKAMCLGRKFSSGVRCFVHT